MKFIRVIKAKEINKDNLKAVIDAAKTLAYDMSQCFGFLQEMGINELDDEQWLGENGVYEPEKIKKLIEKVIRKNPKKALKILGPAFQKIYKKNIN